MPTPKQILFALLAVTAVVAVITDLKTRRIPDALTYPAMALCLGVRLWLEGVGTLETGFLSGLAGLSGAVIWFGAFALRSKGAAMGWGDVKLAGVMGAALGVPLTLAAMVFVSVMGAFQAVVSLIWAGALSDTVRRVLRKVDDPNANPVKRNIPYGVAIALGSFWAMWWD